jgi:hypothetical protein
MDVHSLRLTAFIRVAIWLFTKIQNLNQETKFNSRNHEQTYEPRIVILTRAAEEPAGTEVATASNINSTRRSDSEKVKVLGET